MASSTATTLATVTYTRSSRCPPLAAGGSFLRCSALRTKLESKLGPAPPSSGSRSRLSPQPRALAPSPGPPSARPRNGGAILEKRSCVTRSGLSVGRRPTPRRCAEPLLGTAPGNAARRNTAVARARPGPRRACAEPTASPRCGGGEAKREAPPESLRPHTGGAA